VEVSLSGLLLCLDWSPDGSFLAVGTSDKRCLILDSSLDLVHKTSPRGTSVQTVKWNLEGTFLAIGDREVAILDGETLEIKYEISNVNHVGPTSKYRVLSLCWSPNGSYLAVGGSDGFCLVVETKGYSLVHEIRREACISCLAWGQQIMPGGDYRRYLGVGDDSCNIALLKAGTETDGSVAESDDLSSAASSSYFSSGSDWVLREDSFRDMDEQAPELPRGLKPQANITCVAFSRACKSKVSSYLAYSADDCSLTILTTRDWKPVFVSLDGRKAAVETIFVSLSHHAPSSTANGIRKTNPGSHVFKLQQSPCTRR
jgi:WD40 repeat protein